jgi:hypothetical protein
MFTCSRCTIGICDVKSLDYAILFCAVGLAQQWRGVYMFEFPYLVALQITLKLKLNSRKLNKFLPLKK